MKKLMKIIVSFVLSMSFLSFSTVTFAKEQEKETVTKDVAKEANDKVNVEKLTIESKHGAIEGKLYQIDNDQKKPLVIFAHGLGANADHGTPYAEALAKEGFTVLTFDFNNGQMILLGQN